MSRLVLLCVTLFSVVTQAAERAWVIEGVQRTARVVMPETSTSRGAPLVFVFHGHGGGSESAMRKMNLHTHWPEAIVVYPQGLPTPTARDPQGERPGWQNAAGELGDRDLKFFDAMFSALKSEGAVDPTRVFVHGHSNGGGLTFLLWAERGTALAAIAPSASFGAQRQQAKLAPKPVIHIAGEQDPIFDRQVASMTIERRINGCEEQGQAWPEGTQGTRCTAYSSAGGTPFISLIYPGGHTYPEEAPPLVVRFFQQHANRDPANQTHESVPSAKPAPTPAKPASAAVSNPQVEDLFQRLDQNRDGRLSTEEFKVWRRPRIPFERLDVDSDGTITQDEALRATSRTPSPPTPEKPAASAAESPNENTSPFAFAFEPDYLPGTKDLNGQFTTGTECNYIVEHAGKLFATISCWNLDSKGPNPGAHVLVKKSAAAPWEVDGLFGPDYVRAECLQEVTLTTDRSGRKLDTPVKLLLAGTTRGRPPLDVGLWSRDDASGKWTRMILSADIRRADGALKTGLRAIASHLDAKTGVHYVFAAASAGAIYRGAYDVSAPGSLVWETAPELDGALARIHGFAEANGTLYAAVGVSPRSSDPHDGGLFRRLDGPQPDWEWLYRWEVPNTARATPAMRGLSAIPAADGEGQQLIGALQTAGRIERINPAQNHSVQSEFDIRTHFETAWGGRQDKLCLFAYNNFSPFTHPDTGAMYHLIGGWVRHPGSPELQRSAWVLVRDAQENYSHFRVWGGESATSANLTSGLRGARTICVSPFPEDHGRILYLGGFDAANGPHRDTAWIYKGSLKAKQP
jgi:polyhydroxybutyrate depolymerase